MFIHLTLALAGLGIWKFLIYNYSMNLLMILYIVALFMALVPGILLTLPKGGSKMKVAAVHAVVFAVVFHLTAKAVWMATTVSEGFQDSGFRPPAEIIDNLKNIQLRFTPMPKGISLPRAPSGLSKKGKATYNLNMKQMSNKSADIGNKLQSTIVDLVAYNNMFAEVASKFSQADLEVIIKAEGHMPSIPKLTVPEWPPATAAATGTGTGTCLLASINP